jgi:hypothetical protein
MLHAPALLEEEPPPAELTPEQLEARLEALLQTCTFTVFSSVGRGLFDRDKLVFTTLLTTQIMLKARAAPLGAPGFDKLALALGGEAAWLLCTHVCQCGNPAMPSSRP